MLSAGFNRFSRLLESIPGPVDADAARQELSSIVNEQVERLEDNIETYDEITECEVALRPHSSAFDFSAEGERMRRYELALRRFLIRFADEMDRKRSPAAPSSGPWDPSRTASRTRARLIRTSPGTPWPMRLADPTKSTKPMPSRMAPRRANPIRAARSAGRCRRVRARFDETNPAVRSSASWTPCETNPRGARRGAPNKTNPRMRLPAGRI